MDSLAELPNSASKKQARQRGHEQVAKPIRQIDETVFH
jgi:hypothetical protein